MKKNYNVQDAEHIAMIMIDAGYRAWERNTVDAIKRMYFPNDYSMNVINGMMNVYANSVRYMNAHLV